MARLCQQLIRFRSSFARARLDAIRPVRYLIRRDDPQQFLPCATESEHLRSEQWRPLPQRIDGAFKAESGQFDAVSPSDFQHECPDEIVGQHLQPDFLLDQLRGLATQHVEPERGLDVAEAQRRR